MTRSVLITGSNRGIGLSLCRLYRENGWKVMATCRQSSPALKSLEVDIYEDVDVSSTNIAGTSGIMGNLQIDLLINNAGILRNENLGQIDFDQIQEQWLVNTLGPLRITEALVNNLKEGSKVAMITSRMGSIADNSSGGRYGYRMSKVALNMACKSLAIDLKPKHISVEIFHPGLVGTDMIGGRGNLSPDEAAQALATRIDDLDLQNSGSFWHSNGDLLPW